MPHIKNALIRYRIIDRMIRNPYNPYPSKQDLRTSCEESLYGSSYGEHICDSTIEKDLFAMRMELDAPIKYSKSNEGYYYDDSSFSINEIPLSEDELSSIKFAVKTLQQFQEVPYFKEFGNAIDKIANRVSIVGQDEEDAAKFIGFETIISSVGNEFLPDLLHAIKERKYVNFMYASFVSGQLKKRKVCPLYLKEYRNRWYLISYDLAKEDIVTYALDRMTELIIMDEMVGEKINFNASLYFADSVGITTKNGNPEIVRIETNDIAAKYIETQPFHTTQKRTQNSNIFEFKVHITEELIRVLLGYLGEVNILEPLHLRDTIKERIQSQLEKYKS